MAKKVDQEPGSDQTKGDELQALIDSREVLIKKADDALFLLRRKYAKTRQISQEELITAIEIVVRGTDFQGDPEEREQYLYDINVIVCTEACNVANWAVWIEKKKGEKGKYVVCYSTKIAF